MTLHDAPLQAADCLAPDWPAPPGVRALITTRVGGVSGAPYGASRAGADAGGMNLGLHVGDAAANVTRNRARLAGLCGADARIVWLEQIHGARVVDAEAVLDHAELEAAHGAHARADASVALAPDAVCTVMVADCLPVLLTERAGRAVGAAHAGWRGLLDGVIEASAARIAARLGGPWQGLAYLGPCIGPSAFEVGAEVRAAFLAAARAGERAATEAAFVAGEIPGKFLCDLAALARVRLARAGIDAVYGGNHCTVGDARFYSYRKERVTGRFAALIWRETWNPTQGQGKPASRA